VIKWKSKTYSDLKPFDTLTYDNLLSRTRQAMIDINATEFWKQHKSGRAFLSIKTDKLQDQELIYLSKKYNSPLTHYPTDTQIVLRQYDPKYSKSIYHEEENKHIFQGLTSNVNNRDGFIVGGFSEIDAYGTYIEPKRNKQLTGDWIYLEIPYEYVYNYMNTSINSSPLETAREFVEEVDETIGWNDGEKLKELVATYDEKFPNWNHDFAINGFVQVKKEGLLFPCQWWNPKTIASNATHRMVMMGYNKYDIPFITQVPYNHPYAWYSQSKNPMFFYDNKWQYLIMYVDRVKEELTFTFTEEQSFAAIANKKL
jgi:hypothetical protein|tara:strand:- start:3009 stop:3947 length:939 start_codon:yes stop_codon:yes gene_type:complete